MKLMPLQKRLDIYSQLYLNKVEGNDKEPYKIKIRNYKKDILINLEEIFLEKKPRNS